MCDNNDGFIITVPSFPTTTLQQKSLLPLGIGIDVFIKHSGIVIVINQGIILDKDEDDDEDDDHGDGDHALFPKINFICCALGVSPT